MKKTKLNSFPVPKLIYTKSAQPLILEALGFAVDKQGFIIQKKTKKFVCNKRGTIHESEIIGFGNGKIYTSVFELADDLKK